MSAIDRLNGMSDWDIAFADPAEMRALYKQAEKEARTAQNKAAIEAAAQVQSVVQKPPAPEPEESFFLS